MSPPSTYVIQILASEDQAEVVYSFSNRAHFSSGDTTRADLALSYQYLHNFYIIFIWKVAKRWKYDVMY